LNIFDRLKLRNKIIVILVIQATLLIIFGIIGFQISFSTYKNQLYRQTSQIVSLLGDNVDNKLKRINDLSFEIMTDETVQNLLVNINSSDASYQKLQFITILRSKLLQYSFSENYINSIGIIDLDINQHMEGRNYHNITSNQLNQIINSKKLANGRVLWIMPENDYEQILAVRSVRQINDFSFSNLGYLVIRINPKKLIEHNFDYFSEPHNYFSVFSNNTVILEDRNELNLNPLTFNIRGKQGYFFQKIHRKNYFIYYGTFSYTGWQFAFALPIQNTMIKFSQIQIMILLIYFVIFLSVTYFFVRFSGKIVQPLEKLMINLKDANKQWFNSDAYSDYLSDLVFTHGKDNDEIRFLERDFKLLINRVNALLKENYEEKITVKEWQLKALQSQINPHFLYNTLDTVYWMAKMNNQKDITIIIKSLGKLLRNSIYNAKNITTIGEELSILKAYLNIQKFRFEDRLKVNINISETLYDNKIPNLAIQTLVENSISYGLEVSTKDCSIEIFSTYDDEHIKITVLDNGPGVNQELLANLQTMAIESDGNSGVGLKNIDQRIKLAFGSQYGLFLDSQENKWFKVDIVIPHSKV
jgi:two-component system, sensor histidine kinase YesM